MNKNTNMKKYIVGAFGWLIIFSACVSAQWVDSGQATLENQKKRDAEAEKRRRKEEAFMAAANSNPTSRVLHERLVSAVLKAGESEKILMEATTNGDRDILSYLLARRDKGLDSRRFIDPILVNTYGQTEIVDEALDELKSALEDLKSNDGENRREAYVARSFATEKLAEFKTRKAYLALYRALDDTKKPDVYFGDDVGVVSHAEVTMDYLMRYYANGPRGKAAYNPEAWKAWFRDNHLID